MAKLAASKRTKPRVSRHSRTTTGSSKPSPSRKPSYLTALPADFREFLRSLIGARVRFLLVGGHAVALHGAPRATFDIDVFVDGEAVNLERLARALLAFGFPDAAESSRYLAIPGRFLTLGVKPLRIDILNAIDGVSFAEAWRDRIKVDMGVSAIGLAALLKNKRAAGRPKDLLDVELLRERGVVPAKKARRTR